MSVRLRSHPDFWAAMMFAVVALIFLWQSAGLNMGTASRMGPAYMPRVLCGLMLVVAAVLFVRAYRVAPTETFSLGVRPMLVVPASMVVFALTLRPLGLVLSICLAVAVASMSERGARFYEVAAAAVFLSVFAVAAFVWGLKLNLPIWPRF